MKISPLLIINTKMPKTEKLYVSWHHANGRGIKRKSSLLLLTHLQILIYVSTIYYQNILNYKEVMVPNRLTLKFIQRRQQKNEHSKSYLSCIQYSCLSLPKIIQLSQTVWELWPAQDFGFRGDKYIMVKGRVFLQATRLVVLSYALPNIIKIFQTIKILWSA